MKTFKIFSTAALALMLAACSSEDTALNSTPAQDGQKVPFTATIAAPGSGAGTRTEYTEVTSGDAAGTINVAWKAGDEIALIHNGKADVVKVETVNTDGSATITGDITVGTDGEAVEVCYPAALWVWDEETSGAIRNATFVSNIIKQDGTLKYIQDNLDVRMGEGKLKLGGNKATLSANVKLASQIAIWKLALQDDAETPAALSATQVSVKVDGETPVTIASTEKLSTATSSVYLAIDKLDAANIIIEATVGEDTYSYTNEEISLALGKYYQSTVKMSLVKIVDLSTVTTATTIEDGYTVTGTLGANVKITIADNATVTLNNVSINADDVWKDGSSAGITCLGDATINLEGTNNKVKGFGASYPGIYVPVNKTLIIQGSGSLDASSGMDSYAHMFGAGIGGGGSGSCGNITIKGGNITATGGGAGIGSGYNQGTCGDITISGGTVSATGGKGAAGIGSGYQGNCGDILISGGTVSATGGTDAAGIGSGTGTEGCGAITISGGTVTATGGENAAGIGSGYEGSCGDITISGGTVTATGGNGGAGIGTGDGGSCGDITITTGVTKVTATKGANTTNSIGKASEIGNGSCGTVTIGCTLNNDGNPVDGTTGAISTSPYTYTPAE